MQAEVELDELLAEYEVRQEMDDKAEKELALAQRLYDAKMRRIDASQAGKRHGKPFGELERIYKAEVELLRARLVRSESEGRAYNAEANWLAQQCRVLRLQNAKLQRVYSISCTRESTVTGDKSDVLESQPVILSVLSVPNHARITWYQWFRASRSSKY